ncbi:MAG: tRNA (cytidine(34)-2'-O)-methyltransferase [Proteobacteria bacterium]|nr:tRNA (cytidine(34)-2'-O)-methyltransferase [Pseudomonadota bacterium]
MIKGHPHIGLFQPEIPQNTGSIARLAAGSGCRLHLVRPFGFSAADRNLRRAGLDYWPFLDLEIHDHIEDLLQQFPGRCVFLSKKAKQPYWAIPDSAELFVFGRETSGLPDTLFETHSEHFYQIPMFHPGVRSQNLSNAVSIVIYDRLRRMHSQGTTLLANSLTR